jgi:hypothetical protein
MAKMHSGSNTSMHGQMMSFTAKLRGGSKRSTPESDAERLRAAERVSVESAATRRTDGEG